jgi:hypothetical protein
MRETTRLRSKIENLMVVNDSLMAENIEFDKMNKHLEQRIAELEIDLTKPPQERTYCVGCSLIRSVADYNLDDNDPHAKAMAEWKAMNYMQQGGNKETRQTQRPVLELEYPDYTPTRHDVFVLRHNHELEKQQIEQYWANRGIK